MAIKFECSNKSVKLFHDGMLMRETSRSPVKFQEHGDAFLAMLSGTQFEDIPRSISFYISGLPDEFSPAMAMALDNSDTGVDVLLQLELTNLDAWDMSYSYGRYVDCVNSLVEGQSKPIKKYSKHESTESSYFASLGFTFHFKEGDVVESILKCVNKISIAQNQAHAKLANHESKDVLVRLFDFPDRYSTVCTQYIVWFGELLKKIGLEAYLSTKESSQGMMLSIEHEGGQELTAKIEKLFYGYLSLPYSEYLPSQLPTDPQYKMELLLLKNQVDQFKFNLLQAKNALELQSMKNDELAQELNRKEDELILLKSAQNSKLEILDGALAIEKFKIFGVTVNPKKVLELLKS